MNPPVADKADFTGSNPPLNDLATLYPGAKPVNVEKTVSTVHDSHNASGKIRIRTTTTLDNGMIVIEDVYEDKTKYSDIKGEYKELPLKDIEFPKIPDELRKQVKKDTKKAEKMWENQKQEKERMFDEEDLIEQARHKEKVAADEAELAFS